MTPRDITDDSEDTLRDVTDNGEDTLAWLHLPPPQTWSTGQTKLGPSGLASHFRGECVLTSPNLAYFLSNTTSPSLGQSFSLTSHDGEQIDENS